MNKKYSIYLPLIIAISFAAGMYVSNIGKQTQANYDQFRNNKLFALLQLIESKYADSVDQAEIIEKTIPFILENLDPHSSYIIPEKYDEIQDPIKGSFEGIGIQFNVKSDTIIAIQIIQGGPSERVGLKPGDRIVTINDSIVAGIGIKNNDVVKLLKGPKGTKVTVGVKRNGKKDVIYFEITRDKIPLYSIDVSYMVNNQTAYMKISRFSVTTPDEFMQHIEKLRKLGMKKLILDLRENGGGVLGASIFLANEFLQKNDLIVYTEGKAFPRQDEYADGTGSCQDVELVVLINEFSASASEVFAGAIQDNDRGIIVGRRSFGKGFVNKDFMLKDSSTVRLTIQKFYSPSGRCIQKPYNEGYEAYTHELAERMAHGELEEKDSIHFPDSLKFSTKNGRTVYGGGGIMPEVFVPLDTVGYSEYYSQLVNRGIIYDFAFKYADKNRKRLEKINSPEKLTIFLQGEHVEKQLIAYATKKGIKFNEADYNVSHNIIESFLYAYIAKNILGDEGYYPIILENDTTIKAALESLK